MVKDANGKLLSQVEVIKMKEQRLKDYLKKINNYLDLELYK